ncbi:hypothetical protein HKX48_008927, partial [Thoreauomyces humboldtii]
MRSRAQAPAFGDNRHSEFIVPFETRNTPRNPSDPKLFKAPDRSLYGESASLIEPAHVSEDSKIPLAPSVRASRFIELHGFSHCPILEGASFDSYTDIPALGGSMMDGRAQLPDVTGVIDAVAAHVENTLLERYPLLVQSDVHRYSCYSAAEGANSVVNMTAQPLLHRIDPIAYFSELIPSLMATPKSRIPGPRRFYPLAYLVMIHKVSLWDQTKLLINRLDDGTAVFLIHIDPLATGLEVTVEQWVRGRDAKRQARDGGLEVGNVFLAHTMYEGMWGHASLVWMQLSGFWELLDLANWDFVINLSGHDWPLRTSAEIYRTLNSSEHRGKEHVDYWTEPSDMSNRLMRPHF